jgi:outer membrane protein assembly factor BamE (lipoprotein component of BamABCDE complex)
MQSIVLRRRPIALLASGALALALAACNGGGGMGGFGEVTTHGYVVSDVALQQVPVGSSREQVLIALGSPSTTATFSGEVFYYISQTRRRAAQFTNSRVVDQRVLAIYFDSNERVSRIADYGLQDGQVFDFVTRTTPTGGEDLNFIQQIFRGVFGG